jgi:hypothetical protein
MTQTAFRYHQRDAFWLRLDPCACPFETRAHTYQVHVTDGTDTSPVWDKLNHYDPRCSCCWLNITHSTQRHQDSVTAS